MAVQKRRSTTRAAIAAGLALASGAAASDPIVFDSGYVNSSVSGGIPALVGFSCGSLPSVGFAQRWTAQPFSLARATRITRLDVQGYIEPGAECVNLRWVIWVQSSPTTAPTPATQVASGTVPVPVFVDEPRFNPATPNFNLQGIVAPIDTDFSLPAGAYWLTVFGDTPVNAGGDAKFVWFTNAQRDAALPAPNTPVVISDGSGVFLWRSSGYPAPGFVRTAPGPSVLAVDPAPVYGPTPQDPQYLFSCAFQVRGSCYANCDGSTNTPILNVNDFQCFLNRYAAGDPYANCDGSTNPPVLNVNDFQCFLNAYAAGCQ